MSWHDTVRANWAEALQVLVNDGRLLREADLVVRSDGGETRWGRMRYLIIPPAPRGGYDENTMTEGES